VDALLKTRIEDRPQSVDDILSELLEMPDHESGDAEAQNRPSPQPAEQKELTLDAPRLYTSPGGRVPPRRVPRGSNPWFWIISTGMLAGVGAFTFWPQIEPLLSPPEQESARAPDHIEGTTIPKDILQRPLPADEPPEVPESVNFTRKADDFRMEQYRQLDQRDKEISALLRSARAKIERGELVDPVDENALAVYRAVLLLDEDNVDALQGIDEIGSRLIERAPASLDGGELEAVLDDLDVSGIEDPRIEEMRQRVDDLLREETAARDAHPEATLAEETQGVTRMQPEQDGLADQSVAEQRLAEAEPQAPELESIRRQDETRQERSGEPQRQEAAITEHRTAPEAEDTARIKSLLLQARIASGGGALNRASAADALPYYQEVLSLDPGNEEASAGVSRVYRFYIDQANESLATDRFEDVSKNLDLAAAILPGSETVGLLRQQLALRQSELAEAERKKRAESKSAATRKAPKAKPPIDNKQLANGIAAYYGGRYEEAYARLKPLAEKGSARAQFRLGVMYLRGRGVGQNLGAGTQWIKKAFPRIQDSAVAGEAWAQADLGSLYQTGLLVAKNDAEAVRWYRAAAEQGYAGAQTNLGAMYADGKGVAPDRDEAVKWLRLAAEQGDKIARENLSALGVQNLN
jgi:TPR repeat protein